MEESKVHNEGYPHAELPNRFQQVVSSERDEKQADGAGFVAHTLSGFLWPYHGVPLEKLDVDLFDEYLFDFFPRKISADEFLVERTPDFLIRFLEFTAAEGILKRVQSLIDLVKQNCRDFIRAALDPSNFGPAKSFVMQMIAEGFDPADQDQLNAFTLLYNQRLLAQRSPLPPPPESQTSEPTNKSRRPQVIKEDHYGYHA